MLPGHHLSSTEAYLYDIAQFPRLTEDETADLIHRIHLAQNGCIDPAHGTQAKHRLIEGHLPLVVSLARHYAAMHRPFRTLDLPDLISEGSIALIQIAEHPDRCNGSFPAYAAGAIRKAFAHAHALDGPIRVPSATFHGLKEKGTLNRVLNSLRTYSLDVPIYRDDRKEITWADRLAAPPVLTYERPVDNTFSRAGNTAAAPSEQAGPSVEKAIQIETLLATLPLRQQQVLRLRYGFDPADPCMHTQEETARILGIVRSTVDTTEREALRALQMELTGQRGQKSARRSLALMGNKNASGRTPAGQQRLEQRRHERDERVRTAYEQLRAQGAAITRDALSRAAHVDNRVASAFLRAQYGTGEQERLRGAYEQLQAQGVNPTASALCRLAHVGAHVAGAFLREQRGVPLPRTRETSLSVEERLRRAHEQLEAQGEPLEWAWRWHVLFLPSVVLPTKRKKVREQLSKRYPLLRSS